MSSRAGAPEDLKARVRSAQRTEWCERVRIWGLFAILAAFTVCTLDGGDVPPFLLSSALLLLTAAALLLPSARAFRVGFPAMCLFAMAGYGIVQTAFFPRKIAYDGWTGVLFWFTAGCITLMAANVFRDPRRACNFRYAFIFFGSAICLLALLEQASHTRAYFWTIPSKFPGVYGTFAYWNNFAEFVEILFPVTLWAGVGRRALDFRFVLLAAVQTGAVAMSGSRAGSVLLVVELLAVLALAYLRHRNRAFIYAVACTVVLSLVFVYAAGVSQIAQKLHEKDQLSIRRDIDLSTLEMIRQRPLTGWGLNSYISVYPMFARFDTGAYVNRAHNDWLQWTAEGGVFFTALMLAVFVWSIGPAAHSIWGLGLIAVCLHALVDYPFARFGVCGWYFALLGMLVYA